MLNIGRNGLFRDRKCGMKCLRNASQFLVVNAPKCIQQFLNRAQFKGTFPFLLLNRKWIELNSYGYQSSKAIGFQFVSPFVCLFQNLSETA